MGIFGEGVGGNIMLLIEETARFAGSDAIDGSASGAFSSITSSGEGTGGNVRIEAQNLEVVDGAQLNASTFGEGVSGNIMLLIEETARFTGSDAIDGSASGAFSYESGGEGTGQVVPKEAQNLEVVDGAQLGVSTSGEGVGGNIMLLIRETARFAGSGAIDRSASGAFSSIESDGEGAGGNVRIEAQNLEVVDGAQLVASTFGEGVGGNIMLLIEETARFAGSDAIDGSPSGAFSSIQPNGEGAGGNVRIEAQNLEVVDGAGSALALLAKEQQEI